MVTHLKNLIRTETTSFRLIEKKKKKKKADSNRFHKPNFRAYGLNDLLSHLSLSRSRRCSCPARNGRPTPYLAEVSLAEDRL